MTFLISGFAVGPRSLGQSLVENTLKFFLDILYVHRHKHRFIKPATGKQIYDRKISLRKYQS